MKLSKILTYTGIAGAVGVFLFSKKGGSTRNNIRRVTDSIKQRWLHQGNKQLSVADELSPTMKI